MEVGAILMSTHNVCFYGELKKNILYLSPDTLLKRRSNRTLPGAVGQSDADGRRFDPHVWQNILSLRFDHEKISTAIFSFPLIQEGQLSVTGERIT